MKVPRIVSLVPSATETACALGLGPWLVGRTGFCLHPREWVEALPKLGGTKDVRLDRLRALQPTHVLLNVEENRRETWEALRDDPGLACLISDVRGPADVGGFLGQLANAFGVDDHLLQHELQQALAEPAPARGRVLYLIWRQPWMAAGADTYIARLLAAAGWQACAPGTDRYPVLAPDDPLWRQVDEVWLSSEPYRFTPAHEAELQGLAPQARVRLVDGEMCSWWGARTAAGLRYLRSLD